MQGISVRCRVDTKMNHDAAVLWMYGLMLCYMVKLGELFVRNVRGYGGQAWEGGPGVWFSFMSRMRKEGRGEVPGRDLVSFFWGFYLGKSNMLGWVRIEEGVGLVCMVASRACVRRVAGRVG